MQADTLRMVLSYAPIPMAVFDRDMRYLAASARWVSMFGGGRADLTGLVHYDVFPVPERWRRAHQAGLAGQVVSQDDDAYVAPDGAELRFRWSVHPWHDAGGAVAGILLFIEDVTERWRAERERHASGPSNGSVRSNPGGPIGGVPDGAGHGVNHPL